MNVTEGVGWLATALVVLTGIPQWVLMLRSRKLEGISLHTFAIYTASGAAWMVYGLLKKDLAIGITNCFVIINGATVIILYMYQKNRSTKANIEVDH